MNLQLKNPLTESIPFYATILISIIPIFVATYYPTLDGPAHLYNSQLINELASGNKLISTYFTLNPQLVPNWTGHALLSFFTCFLPGWLAEKLLLLIYFVSLPLVFRLLIKRIAPDKTIFSFLIFPFIFSFPLYLGFYNFSLAITLLFLTLYVWINVTILNIRTAIQLFLLIVLTYFSHAFVFIVLLLFMGLHVIYTRFNYFLSSDISCSVHVKEVFKKIGFLALLGLLPLLLLIQNFSLFKSGVNVSYLPRHQLVDWLQNLRALIVYNELDEGKYTGKLVYLLVALVIVGTYLKLDKTLKSKGNNWKSILTQLLEFVNFWGICAFILLALYFYLPDGDSAAGFVSVRLALLFYLFLLIWITTLPIARWFRSTITVLFIFFYIPLQVYHNYGVVQLDRFAVATSKLSTHIPKNSIVLPVNFSDNWLAGHFSNYLGSDKPMIILENYEAGTGYFPVKWNLKQLPNSILSKKNNLIHPYTTQDKTRDSKLIDFVYVQGKLDTNNVSQLGLIGILGDEFKLIEGNQYCSLYRRK